MFGDPGYDSHKKINLNPSSCLWSWTTQENLIYHKKTKKATLEDIHINVPPESGGKIKKCFLQWSREHIRACVRGPQRAAFSVCILIELFKKPCHRTSCTLQVQLSWCFSNLKVFFFTYHFCKLLFFFFDIWMELAGSPSSEDPFWVATRKALLTGFFLKGSQASLSLDLKDMPK